MCIASNYGLARAFIGMKDYARAAACLTKASELDPSQIRVFYLMGYVAQKNKQSIQAFKAYKHALKLDPKNEKAARNRCSLLMEFKKPKMALEVTRKALMQFGSLELNLGYSLGKKYQAQGRTEQAQRILTVYGHAMELSEDIATSQEEDVQMVGSSDLKL